MRARLPAAGAAKTTDSRKGIIQMADTKKGTTRRNFLKIAGTAVPGAVAVVSGASAAEAAPAPVDLASQAMQDTEHTRAYLESTRF